jgi:translocation protein SEC62
MTPGQLTFRQMVNVEVPGHLAKYAKYLRDSNTLKTKEAVMADKRVDSFKGLQAIKALLSKEGEKIFGNVVVDEPSARKVLQDMMDSGLFLRVVSINNSRYLQPDTSREWSDEGQYAWVYEGSQFTAIAIGLALIAVIFAIPLYPLWPHPVRLATWYLLMLVVAFVAFIGILAVIRAILFVITYFTLKPGVWLFPRLFDETVGIIDSFIPLWEWHKPGSD